MCTFICRSMLSVVVLGAAGLGHTQNQIVSIGYRGFGWPTSIASVAPGQVLTLVTTALDVPNAAATGLPLPTSLSGVSVQARVIGAADNKGYPAALPIIRVDRIEAVQIPSGAFCPTTPNSVLCSSTWITVEVPTERVCAPMPFDSCPPDPPFADLPPLLVLNVKANGITGPDFPLRVVTASGRLLESCDSIFGPQSGNTCAPLVTHADNTAITRDKPARVGETIVVYAVGLGLSVSNFPPSGQADKRYEQSHSFGTLVFSYTYPPPAVAGTRSDRIGGSTRTVVDPEWVGLIPGYVGLYQINVVVPPAPAGVYPGCESGGNTALQTVQIISNSIAICVQP